MEINKRYFLLTGAAIKQSKIRRLVTGASPSCGPPFPPGEGIALGPLTN